MHTLITWEAFWNQSFRNRHTKRIEYYVIDILDDMVAALEEVGSLRSERLTVMTEMVEIADLLAVEEEEPELNHPYGEALPKFYMYWRRELNRPHPRSKFDDIEASIVDTVDDFCRNEYYANGTDDGSPIELRTVHSRLTDIVDICDMLTSLGDEEMT